MSRFSFAPPSSGATQLLLSGEHPTLEAILDCPDFNSDLSSRNSQLISFLLAPATLTEMVALLTRAPSRALHKKVLQLFQTSVTDLFSPAARNLPFVRLVFSELEWAPSSAAASFGIGTLSRMFSRAVDKWPEGVGELLRLAGLLPALVRRIADGVVFQIVADLMTETHPEIVVLAWYIFRALAGPAYEVPQERIPRSVFLAPEIPLDFEQPPRYKFRATELLCAFLQVPFPQFADFRALIAEWLEMLDIGDFAPVTFELAKFVPVSRALAQKALGLVRDAKEIDGEQIFAAIDYLGICGRVIEWWEAAGVIAKCFLGAKVAQAPAVACVEIVRGFENKGDNERFAAAVRQIVSRAWNSGVVEGDRLLAGVCVAVVQVLTVRGRIAPDDLFEADFLRIWATKNDKPDQIFPQVMVWDERIRDVANVEFLARLAAIEEIAEVAPGGEEAVAPADAAPAEGATAAPADEPAAVDVESAPTGGPQEGAAEPPLDAPEAVLVQNADVESAAPAADAAAVVGEQEAPPPPPVADAEVAVEPPPDAPEAVLEPNADVETAAPAAVAGEQEAPPGPPAAEPAPEGADAPPSIAVESVVADAPVVGTEGVADEAPIPSAPAEVPPAAESLPESLGADAPAAVESADPAPSVDAESAAPAVDPAAAAGEQEPPPTLPAEGAAAAVEAPPDAPEAVLEPNADVESGAPAAVAGEQEAPTAVEPVPDAADAPPSLPVDGAESDADGAPAPAESAPSIADAPSPDPSGLDGPPDA